MTRCVDISRWRGSERATCHNTLQVQHTTLAHVDPKEDSSPKDRYQTIKEEQIRSAHQGGRGEEDVKRPLKPLAAGASEEGKGCAVTCSVQIAIASVGLISLFMTVLAGLVHGDQRKASGNAGSGSCLSSLKELLKDKKKLTVGCLQCLCLIMVSAGSCLTLTLHPFCIPTQVT